MTEGKGRPQLGTVPLSQSAQQQSQAPAPVGEVRIWQRRNTLYLQISKKKTWAEHSNYLWWLSSGYLSCFNITTSSSACVRRALSVSSSLSDWLVLLLRSPSFLSFSATSSCKRLHTCWQISRDSSFSLSSFASLQRKWKATSELSSITNRNWTDGSKLYLGKKILYKEVYVLHEVKSSDLNTKIETENRKRITA